MTIVGKHPHLVDLPASTQLIVTADSDSDGFVRIGAGAPTYVFYKTIPVTAGKTESVGPFTGPARCRISSTRGVLSYRFTTEFEAKLIRDIETLKSHRVIASALVEREKLIKEKTAMALSEKFKNLAARAKAVPTTLATKADDMAARLDKVEARGDEAFGKMAEVVSDAEQSVAAAEDAVNQLTNGGPA